MKRTVALMTASRYRVVESGETLPASAALRGLRAHRRCTRPPVPLEPTSAWYCPEEACPVSQVLITARYADGKPPRRAAAMLCPACGEAMEFAHYVENLFLVPVEQKTPAKARRRRATRTTPGH